MVRLLLFLTIFSFSAAGEKIRIACIGDSITFGYAMKDKRTSYPAFLQELLGDEYEVRNFGSSGRGVIQSSRRGKGWRAFIKQKEFTESIAFKPHFVICNLGINDIMAIREGKTDEFTPDYIDLISRYQKLESLKNIFIWNKLAPLFPEHRCYRWTEPFTMRVALNTVCRKTGSVPIDMFSPLQGRANLFLKDGIHPNEDGYKLIARLTREKIEPWLTGNFGGLRLPYFFTDNMVIQRNRPVSIFGTANTGQNIEVIFNNRSLAAKADSSGRWKVDFPAVKAGGIFVITVKAEKTIQLNNVLAGDVWLAAGQSNMRWKLSQCYSGKTEIPKAENSKIRVLNRIGSAHPGAYKWNSKTLKLCSPQKYYTGTWKEFSPDSVKEMSGVAYWFAKYIQSDINVPIGIISFPIGGTLTEAFISEVSLLKVKALIPVAAGNDYWFERNAIPSWPRGRAKQNLSEWLSRPQGILPVHPFQPSALFNSAVAPLKGLAVTGAIWYQGESNATEADNKTPADQAYTKAALKTLISDWRAHLGSKIPFIYAQLPEMDRSWMLYREMQLQVSQETDNCGMAVTLGLGDPQNVHPRNKKDVGQRLALWALANVYDRDIIYSGPQFDKLDLKGGNFELTFKHCGTGLISKDGSDLKGFEAAGQDGKFVKVTAVIKGNKVIIDTTGITDPIYIRYAWAPVPEADLYNREGLPASPFRAKLKQISLKEFK